jgi:hypothetical protein
MLLTLAEFWRFLTNNFAMWANAAAAGANMTEGMEIRSEGFVARAIEDNITEFKDKGDDKQFASLMAKRAADKAARAKQIADALSTS